MKPVFNPFTGTFDWVNDTFNPNQILTHSLNQAGNPLVTYDPVTSSYIPLGELVVTDNNGNVVST